jgi:hypothetical protein
LIAVECKKKLETTESILDVSAKLTGEHAETQLFEAEADKRHSMNHCWRLIKDKNKMSLWLNDA